MQVSLDVFEHEFMSLLSPLDFYHLKFTTKEYYSLITLEWLKTSILAHIKKRLLYLLNDNYNKFIEIMNETGAVISGSFIIQCILGEYWQSDIDIYFPTRGNKEYNDDKIYRNSFYELEQFFYHECKYKLVDSCDVTKYKYDRSISMVRNYKTNHDEIQIIHFNTKKSNMINRINEAVDFDICKNCYYVENNKHQLYIYKLIDILHKQSTFNYSKSLGDSIERCYKYRNRGFTMDNHYTSDELLNVSNIGHDCNTLSVLNNKNFSVKKYDIRHDENEQYVLLTEMNDYDRLNFDINNNIITLYHCSNHCVLCFCNDNQKHICIISHGVYVFLIVE